MNVKITPSKIHNENIILPSSKSELHRALIIMAFSCEKGEIHNCTISNDIRSTINFLEGIGSIVKIDNNIIYLDNTDLLKNIKKDFEVNESGTTLRLIIPFLSKLNQEIKIHTKGNLINRSLEIYNNLMNVKKDNLVIDKLSNTITIKKHKFEEDFIIYGNVSSQFITALLLYQSLMIKKGSLVVVKPIASKPYVDLTLDLLRKFGYQIDIVEESKIITYKTVKTPNKLLFIKYTIESDYSQAAFFMGLGAINNDLSLRNLNQHSLQADYSMIDILKNMNCKIDFINDELVIKKSNLKESTIDLFNCPDIGPILFAVCSVINNKTVFINTSRLIDKESNRILSMKANLEKLGVKISIFDNYVELIGLNELPNGCVFDSFNDHRVAMSIAILSTILKTPSVIKNAECINKSYPDFFKDLKKLGVDIVFE